MTTAAGQPPGGQQLERSPVVRSIPAGAKPSKPVSAQIPTAKHRDSQTRTNARQNSLLLLFPNTTVTEAVSAY